MNEEVIIKKLIDLATKAFKKGEIPVGAILVCNQKIIAKTYNLRERKNNIMGHAEIIAIKKGSKKLKRWNLSDCSLYVTLKPCNMCMEIIKQSRIQNVFYMVDRLDYKHDFSKTNIRQIGSEINIKTYKQMLSNFFQIIR